ncbi:MAG: OmpP1/FadL family transporter, partial [Planctomycetota bacterium]
MILFAPVAHGQGGGIILYENGSPDMGTSYAGHSARADDAATAYQNPAGMTRIQGNELMLGSYVAVTKFRFDPDLGRTVSNPPGQTNGGGTMDSLIPALGTFIVTDLAEDLKFGFTVNAISAAGVDYHNNWIGRTFVTENSMVIANLEPALAYKVSDELSLGVGMHLLKATYSQQLKATSALNAATVEIDDAEDWGIAGTIGGLYEFSERTRIGATFRSQGNMKLSGDVESPIPINVDFDTDFDVPMGANASLFHRLTDEVALLADVGWTDWSHFDNQGVTVGPSSGSIRRDWKDTYRFGVGIEYDFTEKWLFRSGISYDTSPCDDDDMLPDIPVGEQYRISLGVEHDFGNARFGLTYTFFSTDVEIDQVALPPSNSVILDGEYDQSQIHFVGLTVA